MSAVAWLAFVCAVMLAASFLTLVYAMVKGGPE